MIAFALAIAVAAATPAAAQAGLAGQPVTTCAKHVEPGETAAELFKAPAKFDCTTPQTELGSGDFWVRSGPLPDVVRANTPLNVRSLALLERRVTLYGRYADGTVHAATIDDSGISRQLQLGAIVEQTLPARTTPVVQLLWRVEGLQNIRGIVVGARVATPAQSARSNLIMAAVYAAFGGLTVALMIYNLAMWAALRHQFQLAYCVMLAALMTYAVTSSGAAAWWWPGLSNAHRLHANYIALAVSATAALWFARDYFEPRVFSRGLQIASVAIGSVLIASALVFALAPVEQAVSLHLIYSFGFLALMAIVPPVLWRAWRQNSSFLWIFALSWGAPIMFAALRTANSLNLVRFNFWIDNSTILAMTAEALMSSIAIAYRIRSISIERDDARVQELAARALADTDPLTGLLNRRAFLNGAIGREGKQTLLIIDIDHFKVVNETIGHDGGDEVLRVFARALRTGMPEDALVARIGGEEFAILCASERPVEPEEVLARLRAQRMPFDLTVTASIGTCSGSLATEIDWKSLYRRADHALYRAKSDGRDRVRRDSREAVAA